MTNGKEADIVNRMLQTSQIPSDGVLMVHSAFKSLALDGYSAEAVLDALVTYMDEGTVLLPTMSWRFVNRDNPVFDELNTPSNTGVLTEIFRTRYASRRSLHPTHSVAGRGTLVDELLGTHHLSSTPCDQCSPFGRLLEYDAYIVMLAVGMDCCTLIHHIEESIAPDIYCRPVDEIEAYRCRARNGGEVPVDVRHHRFLPRDYWQFQDCLAAAGRLVAFKFDNSVALCFRARDLGEVVLEQLSQRPDAIVARTGQRYRMM